MPDSLRLTLTTIAITVATLLQGGFAAAFERSERLLIAAADPPPAAGQNPAPPAPAAKPPVRENPAAKPPGKESPPAKTPDSKTPSVKTPPAKPKPAGIPEKVLKVLEYVDKHDKAMDGYEGGRNFGNFERLLPQNDRTGKRIRYREWDVNPRRPGVNRGAERMVTGSNGRAYYTSDHYKSFKSIR